MEGRSEIPSVATVTDPERTDRQIAAALGVSHPTVADVRRELEGRGKIYHADIRTDTMGRKQPAKKPPKTFLIDDDDTVDTVRQHLEAVGQILVFASESVAPRQANIGAHFNSQM